MLLRLLSGLLLLAACTGRLRAQTYEPGYLVRSTGDTLRGEIENEFWEQPPTFIRFRPAAGQPSELLKPRQLRAVSFTGGRYFRYEVLLLDHAAETRLADLQRGNFVHMQPDSVLAEVLLTGPVELLRVALPGAVHYEVRRPGPPPLRLSERKYLGENERGGWGVRDGNNYRSQLEMYFIDCPAAAQAAQTAAYSAAGIGAVAQAYATSCAPAAPLRSWLARAEPRRGSAFQGGVLAGVRLNHTQSPAYVVGDENTDGQLHPFGGFYAEALLPSRTAAFYGELTLSPMRGVGAYSLGYDAAGHEAYQSFGYRALLGTARLGIRFLLPLPRDQQFIVGLGFERNSVLGLTLPTPPSPNLSYGAYVSPGRGEEAYATPTLLPNLTLGWRQQRLTATLDGQLYSSRGSDGFSGLLFGSNYALRLGLSCRLGRHPDAGAAGRAQP